MYLVRISILDEFESDYWLATLITYKFVFYPLDFM